MPMAIVEVSRMSATQCSQMSPAELFCSLPFPLAVALKDCIPKKGQHNSCKAVFVVLKSLGSSMQRSQISQANLVCSLSFPLTVALNDCTGRNVRRICESLADEQNESHAVQPNVSS